PRIKPVPRVRVQSAAPKREARPARERRDAKAVAHPAQPTPAAEAAPPSFLIAVIGDSEATRLAEGLDDAFADDPRVGIVDKSKEDSGLVRDDFYDWRKQVKAILDGPEHFDLVVMQIGVNDNQKLRQDPDHQLDPLSKPFNEAYAQRVDEIAAAFRDKNVPLVWVGLPIMRSPGLSSAALVFNDIARQHATAAGARYVDLWEAFSDVNSAYKASGPDINGAIVRLRGPDGVHFNLAGARKAAHFVEPEVKKVLEAKLQPPEAAPPQPENPASVQPPAAPESEAPAPRPEKPLAGKVTPLNDPVLSPGGALAEAPRAAAIKPDVAPQPGRADDFSWPKQAAAPK
ncbi:SGNH/GDSL hydrolase family protein, partial [Rhodoblastus sphagnicola]